MSEQTNSEHGLRSLATMAKSCRVSRQSFSRWGIKPERIEGKRHLFGLAGVLDHRLQAAQRASTPHDAELDRLDARASLLSEQIEAARIRNAELAASYVPAQKAQAAMTAILDGAASIIEQITDEMIVELPALATDRTIIESEIVKAAAALRSGRIETEKPEKME